MLAIGLAAAAMLPRLLGGFSVLRGRDRLHVVLGAAGGALIGVALFDTLPEASELAGGGSGLVALAGAVIAGAVLFGLVERSVFGHVHTEDRACNPRAGQIGAAGITVHAFLDGVAVGTAFQASRQLGLLVSAAVLLHAFADGLNTVAVLLRHGNERWRALVWLGLDATVPIAGAALGLFVDLPSFMLVGLLGFFGGAFLYLGAGSLIPEAHRSGRDWRIVALAASAGLALVFVATRAA